MDPAPRRRSWTIAELLAWTAEKFAEVGVEQPRVDAEHLLAHALGCSRLDLFVHHERLLEEHERGDFREFVRRRLAREPVAYIVGERGFHALDLSLHVDARVLIPRPETEHLVDWLLESIRPPPAPPMQVVDVGTGSGAIAFAIRRARPDVAVTAADVSEDALAVARANAERLGIDVELARSDLLADVPTPPGGWNAVAANLPYIETGTLDRLQAEVRAFEPRAALDGGADGLDLVRRLIAQCAEDGRMARGGRLLLEVGIGQAGEVAGLLREAGFEDVACRRDLGGVERVVQGRRP